MSENISLHSPKLVKMKKEIGNQSKMLRVNYSKPSSEAHSQSKMTSYFQPSPEARVSRKNEQKMNSISALPGCVSRKRIICDSPTREAKCNPPKVVDIIPIDSDTSHQDSSVEEMVSSPKKAKIFKIAKRPIKQHLNSFKNIDEINLDPSPKKVGNKNQLVMRTNHSTSTRLALEEKKNFNVDRTVNSNVQDNEKVFKKCRQKESINNYQEEDNNNSFPSSHTGPQHIIGTPRKKSKEKQDEKLQLNEKGKSPKRSRTDISQTHLESTTSSVGVTLLPKKQKKRPASPDAGPSKNEKVAPASKNARTSIDVDETSTDTILGDKCGTKSKKIADIPKKAFKLPITRRSSNCLAESSSLSINSKVAVGLEEILNGTTVTFRQTYKDLETLLDMNLGLRFCPDFKSALQHPRNTLINSFRVNFNFFMNRKDNDPAKDHLEALGSLRCTSFYRYPHAEVLHTIIHQIMMHGKDPLVLLRAKELVYKILTLHPAGATDMRKYYLSVITRNFNDIDPCSYWESVRCLLEQVLTNEGDECAVFKKYAGSVKPLSKLDCAKAVLGVFIHILNEDLRCWIHQLSSTVQPAEILRDRVDLPLVARMFWPQSTIPHITSACREMISFHFTALNSNLHKYTKPLVKMMAIVTQLRSLEFPLRFQKPSQDMYNLAREIVGKAEEFVNNPISFYSSFSSPELSLLLPLFVLNRRNPRLLIPEGIQLNLTWLLESNLKMEFETDMIADNFQSRNVIEKRAFLSAVDAYFKLFGAYQTWFYLKNRFRDHQSRIHPQEQQPSDSNHIAMFSQTFTPENMMQDLRQTKWLFNTCERNKESMYFNLIWRKALKKC